MGRGVDGRRERVIQDKEKGVVVVWARSVEVISASLSQMVRLHL